MGRGRYNARDHEQDENEYEDRSMDRYTDDANVEDDYIYENDEYEVRPPRRRASETPYPPSRVRHTNNPRHSRNGRPPTREPHRQYQRRVQRKRSFWPALLGGCALGVFLVVLAAAIVVVFALRNLQNGGTIANIPGLITMKPFSKDETLTLPLSQVSQILVCDQVGNVTLRVDPTIDKPSLTIKKTVRAANQTDANKALQQIIVEAQPPNTITHPLTCARSQATSAATTSTIAATPTIPVATNPATATATADNTTLTINVLFPNTDSFNHSVDLNIAFPPGVLASASGPSIPVDVEAPIGDINVDGLSGLLNIRGGTGNVMVTHAILVDGSHIETAQGNVVFSGFLAAPLVDGGKGAQYIIQSEHNVDVTLPGNTNVILDANTNVGKITSDFPINVSNDNGAMNYNGPLNATSSVKPISTLVLDVSTGNITIHRSQP